MKNLKNHDLIRQNESKVKSSQKHDVNLRKNSTLYFQIGLIVCLLATYGVIEMKFLDTPIKVSKELAFDSESDYIEMTDIRIYQEQQAKKVIEPRPKVNRVIDEIEVDKTDDGKEQPDFITPDMTPDLPIGDRKAKT